MERRLITVALLGLVTFTAEAAIYKCTIDGKVVFSQTPCADDAKTVTVKAPPKMGNGEPSAAREKMRARLDAAQRARNRKSDEKELDKIDKKITDLERGMNTQLAKLRLKKTRARNNLAGATWENSISEEMSAVTKQYQTMIENAKEERRRVLERLKE